MISAVEIGSRGVLVQVVGSFSSAVDGIAASRIGVRGMASEPVLQAGLEAAHPQSSQLE